MHHRLHLTVLLLLAGFVPICLLFASGAEMPAPTEKDKAAIAEVRTQLEKHVSVEMLDITVASALDLLAKRAEVNLLLAGSDDAPAFQTHVTLCLDGARAIDILEVLCETSNLNYELRPGAVRVGSVPGEKARKAAIFGSYNVTDLTTNVADFPPPEDMFYPGGKGKPHEQYAQPPDTTPTLTNIADMIRNRVRPESWDATLGTSIEERGGILVVMQTEEIHALIRPLLTSFRSRNSRQVGIDVRSYDVKSIDVDGILHEMEARGVHRPNFDDAGIAAMEKLVHAGAAREIFNGSSVIYNAQLGLLHNLHEQRLLTEYEVSGDTFQPITRQIHTGTVLSATPFLSDDGTLITLCVRSANVDMIGTPENFVVQRGGMISSQGAGNSITVKHKKTDPKKEEKDKKEAEDVTNEYEISSQSKGSVAPTFGPLQIQLPVLAHSRICQDLVLHAGKFAGVSAPLGGSEGFTPGREMLVLMRCRPLVAAEPQLEPEKTDVAELSLAIRAALAKKLTVNLEIPFNRAIKAFSSQTKIPIVVDWHALENKADNPVTMDLKDARAEEALALILRSADATVIPYYSLLRVTSRSVANAKRVTLRIFDIRDLALSHADFPGELAEYPDERPVVTGCVFGTPPGRYYGAADFAAIVKDKMLSSEFIDPQTSVEEQSGKLVVVNTPEGLKKFEQALGQLRKTVSRPIAITTRWAVVNIPDLKAAIGAELPSVLDQKGAEKVLELIAKTGSKDIFCSRMVGFNEQRVSAFGGIERSVVLGYQVSGSILEPKIGAVLGGVMTEVRPLIIPGAGGKDSPKQITIETHLRLSRADAVTGVFDPIASEKGKESTQTPTLPGAPGKVHTPASDSQEISTTVRITDGGAALFRLPAAPWLEEKAVGERTTIVLLQAEQQKD